ncbi:MAG: hypothetical protein AB8B61_04345 [Cyclobacteriaceae bacterium]
MKIKHLILPTLFLGILFFTSCDKDENDDSTTDIYNPATDGLRINESALNLIPAALRSNTDAIALQDLLDEALVYKDDLIVPVGTSKTDLSTLVARGLPTERYQWTEGGYDHLLDFTDSDLTEKIEKRVADESDAYYSWDYSKSMLSLPAKQTEYGYSYDVNASQCKNEFCGHLEYEGSVSGYMYLEWSEEDGSSSFKSSTNLGYKSVSVENNSGQYQIYLYSNNSGKLYYDGDLVLEWNSAGEDITPIQQLSK